MKFRLLVLLIAFSSSSYGQFAFNNSEKPDRSNIKIGSTESTGGALLELGYPSRLERAYNRRNIQKLSASKGILKPLGADNLVFDSGKHILLVMGEIRDNDRIAFKADSDNNGTATSARYLFRRGDDLSYLTINDAGTYGGNVGIGIDPSIAKLEVEGKPNATNTTTALFRGSGSGISIISNSTWGAGGPEIAFNSYNSGANKKSINSGYTGSFIFNPALGSLDYNTTDAAAGAYGSAVQLETTKFSILRTGSVGIGTTPSEKLHVKDGNVKIEAQTPRLYFTSGGGATQWNIWHNYNYGNMLSFNYGSSNGTNMMAIDNRGFLGLGIQNGPGSAIGEKLHVNGGNIRIQSTSYPNLQLNNGTNTWTTQFSSSTSGADNLLFRYNGATKVKIEGGTGHVGIGVDNVNDRLTVGGGMVRILGTDPPSASSAPGILKLGSNTTSLNPPVPHSAYSWIQSGTNTLLLLNPVDGSGAVAINHNPASATYPFPSGYKLYVKGKILCEELKVQLRGSWSDYVFEKDYQLRSLDSVETFIKENKHLPDVPSAKEIEKDGINTGEMDALLLRKIEELTLYMIEQKKEIDLLKKKNEELESKLK